MADTTTTDTATQDPRGTTTCHVLAHDTRFPLATVAVPVGHATEVTVRRLGWRALERAAEAKQREAMSVIARLMGGMNAAAPAVRDVVAQGISQAVQTKAQAREAAVADAKATEDAAPATEAKPKGPAAFDPFDIYALGEVLADGVVTVDGVERTVEAVDDLSKEAAEAVGRQVLRMSVPGLFDTEADRGNA